jgi:hypothetical protein
MIKKLFQKKYPDTDLPSFRVETMGQVYLYYTLYAILFATVIMLILNSWFHLEGHYLFGPALTGAIMMIFNRIHNSQAGQPLTTEEQYTDYESFVSVKAHIESITPALGITDEMMESAQQTGGKKEILQEAKPQIKKYFEQFGFKPEQAGLLAVTYINCQADTGRFILILSEQQYRKLSKKPANMN